MKQEPICTELSDYLSTKGYNLEPYYFRSTGFFVGWKIETESFKIILSQEDNVLMVSFIESKKKRVGLESSVLGIIKMWLDILNNVHSVNLIRGMIDRYGDTAELSIREKMKSLFINHGAELEVIDDDEWLTFSKS